MAKEPTVARVATAFLEALIIFLHLPPSATSSALDRVKHPNPTIPSSSSIHLKLMLNPYLIAIASVSASSASTRSSRLSWGRRLWRLRLAIARIQERGLGFGEREGFELVENGNSRLGGKKESSAVKEELLIAAIFSRT